MQASSAGRVKVLRATQQVKKREERRETNGQTETERRARRRFRSTFFCGETREREREREKGRGRENLALNERERASIHRSKISWHFWITLPRIFKEEIQNSTVKNNLVKSQISP